ncbi:hypothetical protein B7P43_G11114 [Cryptotermes secundus]|uniref:CHCH domain-containing protein n=1 Tax=Cryptotermes secundus TaxID=105785 RepID=A0A2J7RL99_9NEOP|nr:hypothetical protein B7P43_G11114 [Cryptotermes secundus]
MYILQSICITLLKIKFIIFALLFLFTDVACLYEMSILFACFKNNDFNQALCSKEINNFQSCYKNYMSKKNKKKDQEQQGILVPGEKKLTSKQVNVLLRKFPPN